MFVNVVENVTIKIIIINHYETLNVKNKEKTKQK